MCILHYTFQVVQTVYENNPGLKPSMSVVANATSLQSYALNEIPAENTKPPTRINKRNSQERNYRLSKANTRGNRAKLFSRVKLRGKHVEYALIFFWVCPCFFLLSPAISLLQEPPAFCKSKCAQSSVCCLQAALQSVFMQCLLWAVSITFEHLTPDYEVQCCRLIFWVVGEGWDWHAVSMKMELAITTDSSCLFVSEDVDKAAEGMMTAVLTSLYSP